MTVQAPAALTSSTDLLPVWSPLRQVAYAAWREHYPLAGPAHWERAGMSFPETPWGVPDLAPPVVLVTVDPTDPRQRSLTTVAARPAMLTTRHLDTAWPERSPRLTLELQPLWDAQGRLLVTASPHGTAWAALHALTAAGSAAAISAYADRLPLGQARAWRRELAELKDYFARADALVQPLSSPWWPATRNAVQDALDAATAPSGPQPSVRPVRLRPGA